MADGTSIVVAVLLLVCARRVFSSQTHNQSLFEQEQCCSESNPSTTLLPSYLPTKAGMITSVPHPQQSSSTLDSNYITLNIHEMSGTLRYQFPSGRVSHLLLQEGKILHKTKEFALELEVPSGKFISLQIKPSPTSALCEEVNFLMETIKYSVFPCDKHVTLHFQKNTTTVWFFTRRTSVRFWIHVIINALEINGRRRLDVSYHTNVSGTVTPFGFNGVIDYALGLQTKETLTPPPGYSIMLSFPHVHIKPFPQCRQDILRLTLFDNVDLIGCGSLQLPPEVNHGHVTFKFRTQSHSRGYTGFKIRFSFHSASEIPEQLLTNDSTTSVFNCTVPFYAKFQQHLECNLEKECAEAQDEVCCPYFRGDCEPGFITAGSKCYKYVKTTKSMTWYDASASCQKQGLTLASFPTFKQREAFRDGILHFSPTTFDVFIGLRTSESSFSDIYREVWQWSSGVMAYYVHIKDQQLFKPTCAFFGALSWDKIYTTMCGFQKYMQYIFCETETPVSFNVSRKVIPPTDANTTLGFKTNTQLVRCLEGHVTYDFLSCDHVSRCGSDSGTTSCVTYHSGVDRNEEISMYVCDSQTQTIHFTQVCDHRAQCLDSSDEYFCIYQVCPDKQCLNKQCVTEAQWCDGMTHCSDGSDEACPQFVTRSANLSRPSAPGFHVVLFDGHGKYKYVPQGKDFPVCPPTHFLCANRELCVPFYLRCNGFYDCADHEDEDKCTNIVCPGFYKCRGSVVCVHVDHVCDGVFQCPQQDDELLCHLNCPETCVCQGLAFVCPRPFPVQDYSDLRYLDSSGSGLTPDRLFHNHYLTRLILSNCSLHTLPVFKFPNLMFCDLSNNMLTNISVRVFFKLSNLKVLSLSRNPLVKVVSPESKIILENVHSLDMSYTNLKYFDSTMLWNFRHLKSLNLSHGALGAISKNGFTSLTQLQSLDLRQTDLKDYPVKMLQSLSSLQVIFSDIYKLCCQDILPNQFNLQNCHTSPDEISSCKDLLRLDIYRMFLWIYCCFALIGNAISLAARVYLQKGKQQNSFSVFISHLNVSDFLMGLYLVIVGTADQVYRGTYLWHDETWKTSIACKITGFLSLLSCEMSTFIICFITLDRFLVMRFPFSQLHFRNTSATVVCGITWMISIMLAAVPLLPVTSYWEFYSQTGICIPLPINRGDFKGHFYSFGILIVFNFFLFVLIAIGQLFVYLSIRRNSMVTDQKNVREAAVARRLLAVVISDFLCWFPIGLLGLVAFNGVSIPSEVNIAMAIFALPLNSALNPFLYTLNLLMEKRRKASEERLLKILQARYSG